MCLAERQAFNRTQAGIPVTEAALGDVLKDFFSFIFGDLCYFAYGVVFQRILHRFTEARGAGEAART